MSGLLLLLLAMQARPAAIVYITAESTTFRLTPDTLRFKLSEPTSEGRIYVFVDPAKTFRSFVVWGGGDGPPQRERARLKGG